MKYKLTQERFGNLFGLNQPQIRSYEAGSDPGTAKVMEIAEHFGIDPVKFVQFDMELVDVSRARPEEGSTSKERSQPDRMVDIPGIHTVHKYSFVDGLSPDKLRKLCRDLLTEKDRMVKERLQMQARIIQLQEDLLNSK